MNKQSVVAFIKELVGFAVLAAIIVIPIRIFIAQPFIVSGESMSPTFETGQYLIVDQLSYRFNDPKRGDVIIFKFPQDTSKVFIKRIIALPGETLYIEGHEVFVSKGNEEKIKIDEPYVINQHETFETIKLTDEEYFVMGDNRLASLDSRSWGPLNKDLIMGHTFIRLLPINTVALLPGNIK